MEVLKYLWQLPQNIVALIYLLWLKIDSSIVRKEKHEGYTVYFKDTLDNVALGQYVFAYEHECEKKLKHETGHVRQSLYLGPLYLLVIAVPSGLWNLFWESVYPKKGYFWFYTESWANKLAGVSFD